MKIILPKDHDDTALLLGGKRKNFDKGYFNRFGAVLKLNEKQINTIYKKLNTWLPQALELIDISFIDDNKKTNFKKNYYACLKNNNPIKNTIKLKKNIMKLLKQII